MNTPVTATVAEPVRAKRPTLLALVHKCTRSTGPDDWAIGYVGWTLDELKELQPTHTEAAIVTVPGECDDAPSGADPLPWKVRFKDSLEVVAAFMYADSAEMFVKDGPWRSGQVEAIHGGHTTPPGAKK